MRFIIMTETQQKARPGRLQSGKCMDIVFFLHVVLAISQCKNRDKETVCCGRKKRGGEGDRHTSQNQFLLFVPSVESSLHPVLLPQNFLQCFLFSFCYFQFTLTGKLLSVIPMSFLSHYFLFGDELSVFLNTTTIFVQLRKSQSSLRRRTFLS